MLSVFVFLWGIPQVKAFLDGLSVVRFPVPGLDGLVYRVPPVVAKETAEPAVFTFNWLTFTGTGIFAAAVVSGLLMGFSPRRLARAYGRTLKRVRFSLLTVAAMLSLGYVTRYAGLDATLGLAFARTGVLYPFFGTMLGWLGVALTGSDTSSNVLFGSLQKISAGQLGLSPVLMASANSSGGVMGKMIDAQSIVVASTATRWYGHEGEILRYVFLHSLVLAALMGLFVLLQAYVFPFTCSSSMTGLRSKSLASGIVAPDPKVVGPLERGTGICEATPSSLVRKGDPPGGGTVQISGAGAGRPAPPERFRARRDLLPDDLLGALVLGLDALAGQVLVLHGPVVLEADEVGVFLEGRDPLRLAGQGAGRRGLERLEEVGQRLVDDHDGGDGDGDAADAHLLRARGWG